jgi:signal transduction histidine kinase
LRTARHDEQQRLRRDVDGHVMRHLDAAADALEAMPVTPAARAEAAARCERALEELRLIARGIFPSRLGEAGVLVSLDGWLERARTHADIAAATPLRTLRGNPDLESCVYFCAVTALDALAASGADALAVLLSETETSVVLQVRGAGVAQLHRHALTALHDRIEAFDGALDVTPDPAMRSALLTFRAPLRAGAPTGPAPVAEVAG